MGDTPKDHPMHPSRIEQFNEGLREATDNLREFISDGLAAPSYAARADRLIEQATIVASDGAIRYGVNPFRGEEPESAASPKPKLKPKKPAAAAKTKKPAKMELRAGAA